MSKLKSKLENYWYHYKWHTLIVLFFVVFITIMAAQMCSKESDDIYVLYAGPVSVTSEQRIEIESAFSQLMPKDYDGDGKKSVDFLDILLMTDEELRVAYENGYNAYYLNGSTMESNKESLTMQALAGDYVIFLIDEDWYGNLHNTSAFVTFDELSELGVSCDGAEKYDDCAYYLHSMPFAKFFSIFDIFPEDTLVCVRRLSTASTIKGETVAKEKYDRHIEYYGVLTSFALPEDFEE